MGLDLLLMLGGFVGGLINRSMENSQDFKLKALDAGIKDVQAARKVRNKHIAWTRRTLALLIVCAYLFLPTLVNVIFGLPTYVGYEESNGWLVSIFSGDASIVWKQLPVGVVIMPGMSSLAFIVTGFYFGSKSPGS